MPLIPAMFNVIENCLRSGLEDETNDALEVFVALVDAPLPLLDGSDISMQILFIYYSLLLYFLKTGIQKELTMCFE